MKRKRRRHFPLRATREDIIEFLMQRQRASFQAFHVSATFCLCEARDVIRNRRQEDMARDLALKFGYKAKQMTDLASRMFRTYNTFIRVKSVKLERVI